MRCYVRQTMKKIQKEKNTKNENGGKIEKEK